MREMWRPILQAGCDIPRINVDEDHGRVFGRQIVGRQCSYSRWIPWNFATIFHAYLLDQSVIAISIARRISQIHPARIFHYISKRFSLAYDFRCLIIFISLCMKTVLKIFMLEAILFVTSLATIPRQRENIFSNIARASMNKDSYESSTISFYIMILFRI